MQVILEILGSSVIYTAIAFSGGLSRQNPIFSRENVNSWQLILAIHVVFLSVLASVILVLSAAAANLPGWTTENIGRGVTPLDLLLIIIMVILRPIEKRLVYREAAC
jgi:hypothetical protein